MTTLTEMIDNKNRACVERSTRGRGYPLPYRTREYPRRAPINTTVNLGPCQPSEGAGELTPAVDSARSSVLARLGPFAWTLHSLQ